MFNVYLEVAIQDTARYTASFCVKFNYLPGETVLLYSCVSLKSYSSSWSLYISSRLHV